MKSGGEAVWLMTQVNLTLEPTLTEALGPSTMDDVASTSASNVNIVNGLVMIAVVKFIYMLQVQCGLHFQCKCVSVYVCVCVTQFVGRPSSGS